MHSMRRAASLELRSRMNLANLTRFRISISWYSDTELMEMEP